MSGSVIESRRRRTAGALLTICAVAVVVVLLWPAPVDRGAEPLVRALVGVLQGFGVPWPVGYGMVETTANVLMFLPLGLLAMFVLPSWWPRTVAVSATALLMLGGSALAELLQALFLPERTTSARDIVANAAGAFVGALLAALMQRRRPVRSSDAVGAPGSGPAPRTGRRGRCGRVVSTHSLVVVGSVAGSVVRLRFRVRW